MNEPHHLSSHYSDIHTDIVQLLENARRAVARSVNALMTASYWEIGRRIVEFEQGGEDRAAYGEALIQRLALDLSHRFGRGFSYRNLSQMRAFYLAWPLEPICQTTSGISSQITQTLSAQSGWRPRPDLHRLWSGWRGWQWCRRGRIYSCLCPF